MTSKNKNEIFLEIQEELNNMVRGQNRTRIFEKYRQKYGEVVDEILEDGSKKRPNSTLTEKIVMVFHPERYFECPYGNRPKYSKCDSKFTACERNCKCVASKRQKTMLDRYGVRHALQSKKLLDKAGNTWKEKYGVDKLGKINLDQKKQTCIERYGAETPLASSKVQKKIKDSVLEKTGYETNFHNPEIQKSIQEKWARINPDGQRTYLRTKEDIERNQRTSLIEKFGEESANILLDPKKFSEKLKTMTRDQLSVELGCSISLIDKKIHDWGLDEFKGMASYYEIVLCNILDDFGISYDKNTKVIIPPLELGIYIPGKNLAIEFNGLHWHGEVLGKKDRKYHLNKTKMCNEKGIHLIHIFQDEWVNKADIVKSIICNHLGIHETTIYGRKTKVIEISKKVANKFLDENHLQGHTIGTFLQLGLESDGELVSVMTFKRNRGNIELSRFVNKMNYKVIGSASKLFKYALTKITEDIVTYSDRRYFSGHVYEKLGFERVGETQPGYFYFQKANERHDRHHFMKHKLKDKLDIFDPSLSEWENMKNNKWDRIWDCGHYKFIYKNK